MKAVIGLGNPGKRYQNTRHNVGFDVMDRYLGKITWQLKNDALIYEKKYNDEKILFIKPQLYMNLSGNVIKTILDYYKINNENINFHY